MKLPPKALCEALTDEAGFYLVGGELLEAGETPFQSYEIWNTPLVGKLFRLDGCFMTSERDEFFYHENLIHPASISHPQPRTALIIGGGDGGAAEELLKHPSIEKVVLVELDGKVIEIARAHFASVHRGAFDDPRLELRIEDGLAYVRGHAPAAGLRFDLIVLDLTDPVGPAEALYSAAFFADCKALLGESGALCLHLGAPFYHPDRVRGLVGALRGTFRHVVPCFVHIPLYGSLWGLACASDAIDPRRIDEATVDSRLAERGIGELRYYNGATHRAVQALPNYIRTLLAE